jgi:hypothetical protein
MPRSNQRATAIKNALRKNFSTPRAAARALGIDEKLLTLPRMALDGAFKARGKDAELSGEPDLGALRVELEKLLCEHLSDHALQRARDALEQHLGGAEYDHAAASDEDDDEDDEQVRRRADRIEDHLREHGLGEDDLEEARPYIEGAIKEEMKRRSNGHDRHARDRDDDLPRNALHGGMGGRQATAERDADRRLARDERRQRDFEKRFPEIARAAPQNRIETYGDQSPPRRLTERGIARDAAATKNFAARFPQASRVLGGTGS